MYDDVFLPLGYEEESDEDDYYRDFEKDREEFEESLEPYIERQELDFGEDWKSAQQYTKAGKERLSGKLGKLQKILRTPHEKYSDKLYGILSSPEYQNISRTIREKTRDKIEEILKRPGILYFNAEAILAACVYVSSFEKTRYFNKKTFEDFLKEYNVAVPPYDLARYIFYVLEE